MASPPATEASAPTSLPFPPLTKSHILACAYPAWYPLFRPHTPKARIIPLPPAFTTYLRSDGILLPPSRPRTPTSADEDEGFFSSAASSTSDTSTAADDPSDAWPETHAAVQAAVAELGGKVVPKLNWSAPKDAAWMCATNSLECRGANEIYLLLQSSDFVTHDLEHAFDGCEDWTLPGEGEDRGKVLEKEVAYALVLRKYFRLNPSLEFRVFVRDGKVLGLTQRDLNHYDFLFGLRPKLKDLILGFWEREVRDKFTEKSYAMDVYVGPPYERVWIVDFNPWDQRTDPGLFSWLELLTMDEPEEEVEEVVRIPIRPAGDVDVKGDTQAPADEEEDDEDDDDSDTEEVVAGLADTPGPEMRLVLRDDPEAYMFNSTRYSAHKLPRDVVDASQAGAGGMREFADRWKEMLERQSRDQNAAASEADSSSDDDE